ncbi:hypothetical protein Scep_014840 [Stephania cephalantha]|uniref:Mitochondrial protein n=1 Tax=Stephania cephalantha TaxID=152367 RepID=A0AAP0P0V3_9MAGN
MLRTFFSIEILRKKYICAFLLDMHILQIKSVFYDKPCMDLNKLLVLGLQSSVPPLPNLDSHQVFMTQPCLLATLIEALFFLRYILMMIAFGIFELKDYLRRHFEKKNLGLLSYFSGLEVTSPSNGNYLSQAKYASDLIPRSVITDAAIASIPLDVNVDVNVQLTPTDGTLLPDPTLYRQLVGSLVYLTVSRPDIAYVVHIVSQFMAAPRTTHFTVVLRILQYVKGSLFHGLHFFAASSLVLSGYSDVDWAGDFTDRRSTTGYYFFLGTSLIS